MIGMDPAIIPNRYTKEVMVVRGGRPVGRPYGHRININDRYKNIY